MLNELQLLAEELEKDIVVLQQTSVLKSSQLDETRKKMHREIAENQIIRNKLDKVMNELEITKKELEHNVKANDMILGENKKLGNLIAKLQTENEFYNKERQLIKDKNHTNDMEISRLKSQVEDLENKLREHVLYKKMHLEFQLKSKTLIEQILSKMDVLTKEQTHLENFVKESLALNTKLSEERDLQSLFVKEANISRITLENEVFRLIAVLEEERFMKRTFSKSSLDKEPKGNYLEDWKSSQEEMGKKVRFLIQENKRLLNEVDQLKIQLDEQMEKNLSKDTYYTIEK